jgi:hypothetical protein
VVEPGWALKTRRSAAAGPMAIVAELVPLTPEALKLIVMLVATLWDRLVKAIRPATAVKLVVPCKVPLPAPRAALTSVLLLLVHKFPN